MTRRLPTRWIVAAILLLAPALGPGARASHLPAEIAAAPCRAPQPEGDGAEAGAQEASAEPTSLSLVLMGAAALLAARGTARRKAD